MKSDEIRRRFLKFFEKRGHARIPSASLVPEHDPSVLFTTAGMQPLIPYLLGEPHPKGKRLVNVQKCVRTQDIDEVGDNTHDTFFEMLGNWSLGDYFKEDAIKWSYEFLTSKEEGLGLDKERLYITCFKGDENAPKDTVSAEIWESLGIPKHRIYFLGAEDNWWSPGDNGPSGPDTEMFYDLAGTMGDLSEAEFVKATDEQKIVEVWNDVFMEYQKGNGKVIGKLAQQNVDTGAGLERLAMVMQGKDNIFDTDLFSFLIKEIELQSGKKHSNHLYQKDFRILADHARTLTFLVSEGVLPSGTERGSVVRKLLRKALESSWALGFNASIESLSRLVVEKYKTHYPGITKFHEINLSEGNENSLYGEEEKLRKVNLEGRKFIEKYKKDNPTARFLPGAFVANIRSTIGTSLKTIETFATQLNLEIDKEGLKEAIEKHQEVSRIGGERKFKGGLLDHSPQSIKYHTATHLLHQALREVLGKHVFQKGSNITPERLRFDFSFERKMTDEEKKKVEDLVNKKIKEALPVSYEDIPLEEAEKKGALGLFEEKYGDKVRVYKIGDFSLEFCGGPHVSNTEELGVFKIAKEEAVSQGVRRIKAVLE